MNSPTNYPTNQKTKSTNQYIREQETDTIYTIKSVS